MVARPNELIGHVVHVHLEGGRFHGDDSKVRVVDGGGPEDVHSLTAGDYVGPTSCRGSFAYQRSLRARRHTYIPPTPIR